MVGASGTRGAAVAARLTIAVLLLAIGPAPPVAILAAADSSPEAGTFSAEPPASDEALPPPPAGLTAEIRAASVVLTWSPPTEGEDPTAATDQAQAPELIGYLVYRVDLGEGDTGGESLGRPEPEPVLMAALGSRTHGWVDYTVMIGRTYAYSVAALYEGKVASGAAGPVEAVAVRAGHGLEMILTPDSDRAVVNGEEVSLDSPGFVLDGRTMVPLRFIVEYLGAELEYEPDTRQITAILGRRVVRLWVGRSEAQVNGFVTELDSPPLIRSGRVMVPIRFIAEAFDAEVDYDPAARRVSVSVADADDSPDGASALGSDTPMPATLSGPHDVDHYLLPILPGQSYVVSTVNLSPGCDTVLTIHNSSGDRVLSNDERAPGAGESEVFLTGVDAPYPLYYARVQAARADAGGRYTITVRLVTEADDHWEPPAEGTRHPRSSRSGSGNSWEPTSLTVGGEPFAGELAFSSDADWYSFDASAGTDLMRATGWSCPTTTARARNPVPPV